MKSVRISRFLGYKMNEQLRIDIDELCSDCSLFSKLQNCSLFVTGSTGLIGSLFIKAVIVYNKKNNSNIKVYALCRNKNKFLTVFNGFTSENLIPVYSDILKLDLSLFDFNIDYIIHGAAITVSKEMVEHCVETLDTAYIGTKNVLELARMKNVKSIVYLSSMEAFGIPDASLTKVTEKDLGYIDVLNPRSSYSEGKRVCEALCACYKSEHKVPVKIIRLAQTVGAGIDYNDTRVVAMFARCVVENKDITLKTYGNSKRQIIYATDAISAILTVLLKGVSGECYTACNPDTFYSIKDTALMICERISEKKIKVKFDIQNNTVFAPDVIMNLSSDKLQALGWKSKVGLEEAYVRLIKSFKN